MLDSKVSKKELPRFVAFDLTRIPPFVPDATDFCSLATNVELLQSQMVEVMKRLSSVWGRTFRCML